MRLRIATAAFALADIDHNLACIERQIAAAAHQRADVILFPETALSGYVGDQFASFRDYPWDQLERATEAAAASARSHGIWVVLGTSVRLPRRTKPRNSLLVIDPRGRSVARYDKRLCTKAELDHYAPGDAAVVVRIAGVRCGLLICHEWRYPELYREYKARKVDVILQAWYDAGHSPARWRSVGAVDAAITPRTVQGHAVCNHVWIAGANSSLARSGFGGFVVRPDGTLLGRQRVHRAGVMVREIDTAHDLPDRSAHGRARAARLTGARLG